MEFDGSSPARIFNSCLQNWEPGAGMRASDLGGGNRMTQISHETLFQITMPKMKIETDFKLRKALIAMGVTNMFSEQGRFDRKRRQTSTQSF
ncbi:hypothetical protein COOONC_17674 [Cooperia oncophora]